VYLVFVPSLFFPLSSSLSAHTSLGPVQTASKQAERIFFGDSGSEWSSAAALNSKLRSEACSHSPMSTGTGVLTHLHSGQFSMFFFSGTRIQRSFFPAVTTRISCEERLLSSSCSRGQLEHCSFFLKRKEFLSEKAQSQALRGAFFDRAK
jgi:hypothetical protein